MPEDLNQRLDYTAKSNHKPKAEVIREALEEGLKSVQSQDKSAKALLKLAKLAEQLPNDPNTPKDLSTNHDYYLWGGKKKKI